ncbi:MULTISPECIES: DUF742 domain-containing protein [Micromonospora]|uniref:DUF742 domain-containing protein n=1 Tax=Micromonospora yangpuensis TaxID=683228 RepID=A0A1C6UFP6_9ACTN|nr:DUF742 domain-containing protein [Micromonospora yangpuensis]GGM05441.1 hypothetical protein GCM10012279_23960 [Micromonospora yangpuensis]SCL52867.1 Protein of unknown function [Micromonospora yangpuensis]
MPGAEPMWIDDEAGPLVRPYAMTGGRARPKNGFNVISLVLATGQAPPLELGLSPEHQHIVNLCQRPLALAEVAAHLRLPLGTVRVLLDDLLARGLVRVSEPRPPATLPDNQVFEALINGLRKL